MIAHMLMQVLVLHHIGINWELSFIDSIVSALVLAFFCFDLIMIFSFYQPGKGNHLYRAVFIFVFASLYCLSLNWILGWLLHSQTEYLEFLHHSEPVRFAFALLIFLFLSGLYWLWSSLSEQKEKEKRRSDMEQLAKEAELATLRQKLQPHFLFNSLNSISALAVSKPAEARKMIQQLSDFLRGTLKKDDQKNIPLSDELAHLNLYLEIEKVRFGHRLNVEMEIEETCKTMSIPSLLIQPIVENAIKFGLYGTLEDAVIRVNAFAEKNNLIIKVTNPYDPEIQGASEGTGFGLSSVTRRLFLLHARMDLLSTEKKENEFITTLKIPQ